MNTAERGCYTEAVIIAALLKRGYEVFKPVATYSRCDLMIVVDGEFKRVQCKTARLREGVVKFNTYSQCGSLGGKARRHYRNAADLFLAFCEDNDTLYMVPVVAVPTCECYLRIEPPKNNQVKGILWAADYEIQTLPSAVPLPPAPKTCGEVA